MTTRRQGTHLEHTHPNGLSHVPHTRSREHLRHHVVQQRYQARRASRPQPRAARLDPYVASSSSRPKYWSHECAPRSNYKRVCASSGGAAVQRCVRLTKPPSTSPNMTNLNATVAAAGMPPNPCLSRVSPRPAIFLSGPPSWEQA